MKPPFGILVVPSDGSRVVRFHVSRWAGYGAAGVLVVLAAAAAVVSGEYLWLEQQRLEMAALRRGVAEQRARMDEFQQRVASVRGEISTWKTFHAKMWEAVGGEPPEDEAAHAAMATRRSDEIDLLAASVAEEGPRLRELERVIQRTGEIVEALPLRWPARGPVNSGFGPRRSPWSGKREEHEGIDIGTLPGTPIVSPAAGTVTTAAVGGGYGKHVTLDHGNGVSSLYGHLRKMEVKVGERVEKGQVIGLAGNTGRSTGPHLHYEVLVKGEPVDPRDFLLFER